jgi:hypothetical protein
MAEPDDTQSSRPTLLSRFIKYGDRFEPFSRNHTFFVAAALMFISVVIGIIATVIVTVVFFVVKRESFLAWVSVVEASLMDGVRRASHSYVTVLLVGALAFAGVHIWRQRKAYSSLKLEWLSKVESVTELQSKVDRLQGEMTLHDKNDFDLRNTMAKRRWESLKPIRYRPMIYEPLLHRGTGMLPTGFGLDLLTELLESPRQGQKIALEKGADWMTWSQIEKGFEGNPCEIFATPLFSTSERSKFIRFSAPLFFSNIGFYTTKLGRELICELCKEKDLVSLKELVAALQSREARTIKVLYLEGEISEKMSKKHAGELNIEKSNKDSIGDILMEIAQKHEIQGVFCESYTGHNVLKANGLQDKVFNVLLPFEILYPVCYALRLGDYQLTNLINFQIMDRLKCSNGNGVGAAKSKVTPLAMLKAYLENPNKRRDNVLTPDEVSEHFIDHWPFPLQTTGTGGASHA